MSHPDASAAGQAPDKSYAGLIWALICGGALIIATVVAIGAYRVAAVAAEPSRQVVAYLTALEHGEASKALKLDGTKVTATDPLLTDRAYRGVKDRISDIAIVSTASAGDTTTVVASFDQGGDTHSQTFTLTRSGRYLLVIDKWKLAPVQLGTVKVAVEGPPGVRVTVGGTPMASAAFDYSLRALPGDYDIAMTNSTYLEQVDPVSVAVTGFGTAAGGDPVALQVGITDAGKASAAAAVNKWVDACIASTSLKPAGCSFGMLADNLQGITLSHQKWKLESRPTFTVGAWSDQLGGWAVTVTQPGAASFSADARDAAGDTGTFASIGTVPVKVGGTVTFNDSGAEFTSQQWLTEQQLNSLGGSGSAGSSA